MEKEFFAGIEEIIGEVKKNGGQIDFLIEDLENYIAKSTSAIDEDFITQFKEIKEEAIKNIDDPLFGINDLIQDLDILIAITTSILSYEEHMLPQGGYGSYFRIFPKDGTSYIDLVIMYQTGLLERDFIIFKKLYDKGLTKYVEKIFDEYGPKGRGYILKMVIKNVYSIEKVQNEFWKHFKGQKIFDYNWDYPCRIEFTNE